MCKNCQKYTYILPCAKITFHYDLFVHHLNQLSQPGNVNVFLFLLCGLGQQTPATNMMARVKVT